MKLKQVEKDIQEVVDAPYVLIASTSLISEFRVFLQGDTLKQIVQKMRKGEDLRITIRERKMPLFEIVDTHTKYKEV